MKRLLITGSSGLIGSEVCLSFAKLGWEIHGIDNNQREVFFGACGDTRWNQARIGLIIKNFTHHELDIRNRSGLRHLIKTIKPNAIVHAAAQPSHDKAAAIPFDDFDINAGGTFNLLEATRQYSTEIPFIHLSTNKVYGDGPNKIKIVENSNRFDFDDPAYSNGIAETFNIDQTTHSLFGASKLAADVSVQEYGRYFNMPTVCLRAGCLTGESHAAVELHGFLSYLIKCNLEESEYKIFGYKGKQVRDNLHAVDVADFIARFVEMPRVAEVYNIGGGKDNSCSILEAFDMISEISGKKMKYNYLEANRLGDHICYYSDLRKIRAHYPGWEITKSVKAITVDIYESWHKRMGVTKKSSWNIPSN